MCSEQFRSFLELVANEEFGDVRCDRQEPRAPEFLQKVAVAFLANDAECKGDLAYFNVESCKQATIPSGGVRGFMVRAIKHVQRSNNAALTEQPRTPIVAAPIERDEPVVHIDLNTELKTISFLNIPIEKLDAKSEQTDKLAHLIAKAKKNQIQRFAYLVHSLFCLHRCLCVPSRSHS